MVLAGQRVSHSRLIIPDRALAAGRFGGFKPSDEGPQQIRSQQVSGDELQRLRAKREMLKGMTPEQAYNVIEWHNHPLSFIQAIALANETGKLIVPNIVIDRILKKARFEIPSVRTGTLVIHEAPDKPFGDTVFYNYHDIGFSVPTRFQGRKNCALVVEYPDFALVRLENGPNQLAVPDESHLHLVERFPRCNDRYLPDADFGVPYGTRLYTLLYDVFRRSLKLRTLWRESGSYVGPIARGIYAYPGEDPLGVVIDQFSSTSFGVALI